MKKIDYPAEVSVLIGNLKQLPGIGPRSAERIAVWLLREKGEKIQEMVRSLLEAERRVVPCQVCGFFATEEGCGICLDDSRLQDCLCIVEDATDILPLERSGAYCGQYHSLGGRISPLDNVRPEDLSLGALFKRLEGGVLKEVILGVGYDVEGEATANYLVNCLEKFEVTVTRLAQGLPAGGGLDHADDLTFLRALEGRRTVGGQ